MCDKFLVLSFQLAYLRLGLDRRNGRQQLSTPTFSRRPGEIPQLRPPAFAFRRSLASKTSIEEEGQMAGVFQGNWWNFSSWMKYRHSHYVEIKVSIFWLLAEPLVTVDCTKLAINPLPIDVNSTFLSFFRIFRRSSSTLFSSTIAPTSTSNLVPRPSRIFPAAFLASTFHRRYEVISFLKSDRFVWTSNSWPPI